MDMCEFQPIAIRVHRRTLDMITALNGGVTPEIEEKTTFFMIYCAGSDHEETEIISEETYARTYEPMPDHVHAMTVNTID